MANGTSRTLARVRARRVLPLPVGPIKRMFDLSTSTSPRGPRLTQRQALVMVMDGDGEHLLRATLADHILIEAFFDLARRRDVR